MHVPQELCDSALSSMQRITQRRGDVLQAMVELYEFLLRCSCGMAQEAPPPRRFRMSGGRPVISPDSCHNMFSKLCPCLALERKAKLQFLSSDSLHAITLLGCAFGCSYTSGSTTKGMGLHTTQL